MAHVQGLVHVEPTKRLQTILTVRCDLSSHRALSCVSLAWGLGRAVGPKNSITSSGEQVHSPQTTQLPSLDGIDRVQQMRRKVREAQLNAQSKQSLLKKRLPRKW